MVSHQHNQWILKIRKNSQTAIPKTTTESHQEQVKAHSQGYLQVWGGWAEVIKDSVPSMQIDSVAKPCLPWLPSGMQLWFQTNGKTLSSHYSSCEHSYYLHNLKVGFQKTKYNGMVDKAGQRHLSFRWCWPEEHFGLLHKVSQQLAILLLLFDIS